MLTTNQKRILVGLRNNARKSVAEISRDTGIKAQSIFKNISLFENSIIKKYFSIIDFRDLGFYYKVCFAVSIKKDNATELLNELMEDLNVNSIFKITNGENYLIEAIFRNMEEIELFSEKLDGFAVDKKTVYHVIKELKKEAFFTKNSHIAS